MARDGGRHWGGSGDYVEGERVFAPPHGSFDPDWVAGLVLDRLGADAGLARTALATAALADAGRRGAGLGAPERAAALTEHDGVPATTAGELVRAVDDFAAAYWLD
ncbi:hypothetical protein AB2L27_17330 [Kineococcus sp. LSe6-4]|uniref:Uncharacterized protein n=1 Tax=Kineococcus halophytocola TaxID=3234027 RepID=A0ABV4H5F4_9ACTN